VKTVLFLLELHSRDGQWILITQRTGRRERRAWGAVPWASALACFLPARPFARDPDLDSLPIACAQVPLGVPGFWAPTCFQPVYWDIRAGEGPTGAQIWQDSSSAYGGSQRLLSFHQSVPAHLASLSPSILAGLWRTVLSTVVTAQLMMTRLRAWFLAS
jgi:hypothetical protein